MAKIPPETLQRDFIIYGVKVMQRTNYKKELSD
jgi:hypothetical protein